MECKTILKFLKIDADDPNSKIDRSDQEIHLIKIDLSKNSNDDNKYDYSYINFVAEKKNNINNYIYNKENPTFELYYKTFADLTKKIDIIYNRFLSMDIKNNSENCPNRMNDDSDLFDNMEEKKEEKSLSDNLNAKKKGLDMKIRDIQEGNMDKLFMYYFEEGITLYSFEEKVKALENLYISRYLSEFIIFIRVILGNKDISINFDKIINENEGKQDEDTIFFSTFLGGKINILKEKGIIGTFISSNNLAEVIEPKIENIKIYDTMINFYPRIIQFIKEIENETKDKQINKNI